MLLTYKYWNHDLRICEEYDETYAQLEMVEHLSAVIGHIEKADAYQHSAHEVMDQLNPETWNEIIEFYGAHREIVW